MKILIDFGDIDWSRMIKNTQKKSDITSINDILNNIIEYMIIMGAFNKHKNVLMQCHKV